MATNYFRMDGWVKSAQGPAVPGAQIYVCTQPANTVSLPPTPLANIFSDVNGLVPITQPIITDGFGHYDFYASAAVYTIVVGLGGVVQQVYPDQSIGGASGSTGGGGGTALVLQANGTPTVNQLLANFRGAGNTTVTSDPAGDFTISSTATQFSTAGLGWFLGGQSFSPVSDSAGTAIYSSLPANTVVAVQLVLDAEFVVSKMAAYCITGSGISQPMTAGIYSADGNTLLVNAGAGAFDMGIATRKYRTVTLSSPVTLPAGVYWFAYGATTNANQGSVLSHISEQYFTAMINGIDFTLPQTLPTRYGTAANLLSAGALPATLGAITPLDNTNPQSIPVVMFIV